jgi:hypothetical protein
MVCAALPHQLQVIIVDGFRILVRREVLTSDRLDCFMERIDIDAGRLEIAKQNLAKVDVLGVQEHFVEFLRAVNGRTGWSMDDGPDVHVSDGGWEPSAELLDRIRRDNAMDAHL